MDHVTVLIGAEASRGESQKLARSLDAIHVLVEVDARLDPGAAADDVDWLCLWTPWQSATDQRCDRAIKTCIGWIGSRAARVRRTHRLVVFGANDRTLRAVDIVWPGRKIVDASAEGAPTRPSGPT